MKRYYLYIACLLLLLVGCGKDSEFQNADNEPSEVRIVMTTTQSRAEVAEPLPLRYIMEVYRSGDKALRLDRVSQSSGNMVLRLPEGIYDFYFWADLGTEYYNAESLKSVNIVKHYTASVNRVCYAGASLGYVVSSSSVPLSVTLTRPVVRINYINTGITPVSNLISITYREAACSYDVTTMTSSDVKVLTVQGNYSEESPFATDYLFPAIEGVVSIELTMDGNTKQMSNISYKANNQTNITTKFN